MRPVLVVVLVAAIGSGAALAGPAAAREDTLPRRCAAATRAPESVDARRGATPVLFVHGFNGGPRDFRSTRDGRTSMVESVAELSRATAYTFDYSEHAFSWVTDPNIGPSLARSIVCLARASGRKVVIVAHSMGGLAAQYAQGQTIRGQPVASRLARVVTVGTPARA